MSRQLFALAVILTATLLCSAEKSPKVCNRAGACYIGKYMNGFQVEAFEAFFGIPYAKPPINELRFKNPEPFRVPKSGLILNCTQPKQDCIQKNYLMPSSQVSGVEDCLYLNVYRPKQLASKKTLLPVLVYIHGGGWFSGTTNPGILGPEYFMDTGRVILVTMNYRLGPFGFLSSGDDHMPGNFGLKDQTLALQWIKKNIVNFNGDPKRVSIMGQSAGGVSVHMHLLSKLSKGLFQSAMALSGNAIVPFSLTLDPLKQFKTLASFCNITNADQSLTTYELAESFRSLSAEQILSAADRFKYWDVDNMVDFKAVLEPKDSPQAFLTEYPEQLLQTTKYNNIPFLMSTVPGEGGVRAVSIMENENLRTGFNENFDELLEKFLEIPQKFNSEDRKQITNKVVQQYFQGQHQLQLNKAQRFVDIVSHRGFQYPLLKVLESYENQAAKYPPVVLYFNYSGPFSYTKYYTEAPHPQNYGVVHCDDLIYLFRSPFLFPDFAKDSPQSAFIKFYTNFLLDFAFQPNFAKTLSRKTCRDGKASASVAQDCKFLSLTNSADESFELKMISKEVLQPARFWTILD